MMSLWRSPARASCCNASAFWMWNCALSRWRGPKTYATSWRRSWSIFRSRKDVRVPRSSIPWNVLLKGSSFCFGSICCRRSSPRSSLMNSASVVHRLSGCRPTTGVRPMMASVVLPLVLLSCLQTRAEEAAKDQDLFNQGKVLMFDKKWEDARAVFQRVIREFPKSTLVPQAHYFAARCFQQQGKEEEAVRAYDEFVRRYPGESYLLAEARNSVVDLAASLMEKGNSSYRDRIVAALNDPTREVRYFAAIRSSSLDDRGVTSLAIPV